MLRPVGSNELRQPRKGRTLVLMANTLDYEQALSVVDEWLMKLEDFQRVYGIYNDAGSEELDDWFKQRQPLLQRIGTMFGIQPNGFGRYTGGGETRPWIGTRDSLLRLRGELSQHEERKRLFPEAVGPRARADQFHPWVWDAARHLWDGEHRRAAVGNAATALEVMLKAKLGREDVSGAKAVGEAFSLEPPALGRPRLRFPELTDATSERWRSAHLGAMHLGQGCFEGIRNWTAHTLEEADEQTALEYLAALSVFARWVDRAIRQTV